MLNKLRPRSAYDVIALLALFVAMGGTAYAVGTIGSADVIDESLLSADIKNGEIKNADIASSAITSAKIYNGSVINSELGLNAVTSDRVLDNALTGSDINESTLGSVPNAGALGGIAASGFVQGRGELLSNRIILPDPTGSLATAGTLVSIPGFGTLQARCFPDGAGVTYTNTLGHAVDAWSNYFSTKPEGEILGHNTQLQVAFSQPSDHSDDGGTLALGSGTGIATLQVFAFKEHVDFPCGFQVQGTSWTP